MGQTHAHAAVALLVAGFSRHPEALRWARERIEAAWGPIADESQPLDFVETDYYAATMGHGLKKQFWALARPFDPARLPETKLQTNAWEKEYAQLMVHDEPRPLNLDPGYITPAKLVLASTKDHAHRVYLDRGIYAEVTLHFQHGAWRPWPWTFPDYRRADYQQFFVKCRALAKRLAAEETA
jgi:hypothetical protein